MDNFYNIDSFEHFLRDSTKDFKMMPKRRLWFSIYNNLHPSKKLPSVYTSLLLIIVFLSLDFLNVNNISQKSVNVEHYPQLLSINNETKINSNQNNAIFLNNSTTQKLIDNHRNLSKKKNFNNSSSLIAKEINHFKPQEIGVKCSDKKTITNSKERNLIKLTYSKKLVLPADDFVFNKIDFLTPFSYEFYASPSIGFNTFNDEYNKHDNQLNDKSNRFKQISNIHLYAGGSISYNINKSIRIKAGLEFSYSKSSFTDGFSNLENSNFKNNPVNQNDFTARNIMQKTNLELNSYNISLPIGTDFELAGNDNLHWYAGASIEPTFKINDNPVFINEEVKSNSNLKTRNWNLNTNFETFLSLKISKNSFFNAGPQFRYQWFSNYEDLITPGIKAYNLGMKFGVSKTF